MVTGEVTVREALVFGGVLDVASTVWFALRRQRRCRPLLSLLAIALYAVGYTMLLKRRTSQNIVWGGIAGCMPTLIGWSAVTGTVGWPAVVLFLVIFFWTPPHYWPLSMAFRDDYANAEVPMLPVERGPVAVGGRSSRTRGSWWPRRSASCRWPRWAGSTPASPSAAGAVFLAEAHRLLARGHGAGSTARRSSRCGCSTTRSPT